MASGYDGSGRNPLSLLKGRLGVYDKRPYDPEENSLSGVQSQSVHFRHNGGHKQQERMIKDKRRSLDRAVWYSYQAAEIARVGEETEAPIRALINPNKVTQDYDDKIISVGFEHELKCGDVFTWLGTNSHWLIYLQDLTELAYFRGDIRRCSYEIAWEDESGSHRVHAALKGPKESRIQTSSSHGISMDFPNYSLSILMPKNEATLKYFTRYNKFYLQGHETCWRIEAVDQFSTPGVLEISAIEYYANKDEDDIQNGVVGGLIVEQENPNSAETESAIIGETFIKVKRQYTYTFKGRAIADWTVDKKYPVKLIKSAQDPRVVSLTWDSSFSGQFELNYGKYSKTIIVESLF